MKSKPKLATAGPKEYYRRILFPILQNYPVHVVIADDIVAARARRNRAWGRNEVIEERGNNTEAFHEYDSDGDGGVSRLFFRLDAGSGTIAHECWHVVRRMFEWAGAELENEMVAYHLGHLVGEVTRIFGENGVNDMVQVKK